MDNLLTTTTTLHFPTTPQTPSTPSFEVCEQEHSSKYNSRKTLFDLDDEYIINKNPIFRRRIKGKSSDSIDNTTFLGRNIKEQDQPTE